jgi:hypothetical protein
MSNHEMFRRDVGFFIVTHLLYIVKLNVTKICLFTRYCHLAN